MGWRPIFFVLALMVGLGLLAGMIEGTYLEDDVEGTIETLVAQPDIPFADVPLVGNVMAFFSVSWQYVQALWKALWFDYPFFAGGWGIVRLVFLCFSAALVYVFLQTWIRGIGGK